VERNGKESPNCADGFENGVGIGELFRLQLGIDFFAINADLKSTTTGGHQFQCAYFLFESQELFRQTDGLWLIVSNAAIFDCDFQAHVFVKPAKN
jgi:hypothetical protein